jgi:integrase
VSISFTAPNGRRVRRKRYAKSEPEARRLLRQLQRDHAEGRIAVGPSITVEAFGTYWLTEEKAHQVRATTLSSYGFLLSKYVYPVFGRKKLESVAPADVATHLSRLHDTLSTNTVRRVRAVMHKLFKAAVSHNLVVVNPVRTPAPMRRLGEPSQVREPLSLEEARDYLEKAFRTDLDAFVFLLLYTGMRRCEVLGLRWVDLDLQAGVLDVRKNLVETTVRLPSGAAVSRRLLHDPKTRSSARTIKLAVPAIDALKRQQAAQARMRLAAGAEWTDTGMVFTGPTGDLVWPSNYYQRFRRWVARSGLRYVRIHDQRHTVARLMLIAGIPAEAVCQALGHSSINITMSVYAPYVQPLIDRATEGLATYLQGVDSRLAGELAAGSRFRLSDIDARPGHAPQRFDRPAWWQGDR